MRRELNEGTQSGAHHGMARRLARVWTEHWPFLVVAIPALALYLAYGGVVLPDFGADEPAHVEYVHVLSHEWRLPTIEETYQVHHGPVYYALVAIPYRLAAPDTRPSALPLGPEHLRELTASDLRARRVVRAVQSLVAIGTLLAVYATLRCLLPRRPWAYPVPVALVAASPQFGLVAATVNNDQLSYLWSAVACLLMAPLLVHDAPADWRRAAWIGAWLGLGIMVKQTTLFAAPVAFLLLLRRAQRPLEKLLCPGVLVLALFAVGCWWPLRNYRVHGSLFPDTTSDAGTERALRNTLLLDPFNRGLRHVIRFADVVGLTALSPEWAWSTRGFAVKPAVRGVLLLLFVATALPYLLVARRRPVGDSCEPAWRVNMSAAGFCVLAIVVLWLGILQRAFWVDLKMAIGGRYLLNAAPWFALAFLGAEERLAALMGSARMRHALVVVALLGLAVGSLWYFFHAAGWYAAIARQILP